MKAAHFDCFSGISGNMILGALVDLGVGVDELQACLGKLRLKGYRLEARRVERRGISGMYVELTAEADEGGRTLGDVLGLIDQSDLDEDIRQLSRRVFVRLGEAEARVHNVDVDRVRLHELGATDTIVDVVGAVAGLKMLGIERVTCSPLNLGRGMVKCDHGLLPIPAPMTAELLRGVPVRGGDVDGELTTPTGAAIISTLATQFGEMPALRVDRVGYGAGSMDLSRPNLLRVFVGEALEKAEGQIGERVSVLETNIDDMNPEFYDHIMERLFEAGALDVFLTPVQMKKNRPGTLLSVLAPADMADSLLDILLQESTTLGVRVSERERFCLPRFSQTVKTRFGDIRVKVAHRGSLVVKVLPEYEDCKRIARETGVAISQVYGEAQKSWQEANPPGD